MLKRTLSLGYLIFLVIGFLFTVQVEKAHAYLDLGSGSLFLQILLASLFAFLFTIRAYWRRFSKYVSLLLAKFKTKEANDE